jgi:hypothetical protein
MKAAVASEYSLGSRGTGLVWDCLGRSEFEPHGNQRYDTTLDLSAAVIRTESDP